MISDLIRKNRSYRRFNQSELIHESALKSLVDLARLSASGRNAQPLKYLISCDPNKNALIFETLSWAAYLKTWKPDEGERPAGYIAILGDTQISSSFGIDHGIAAQSILLGAVEVGLGGCIIASINKPVLQSALNIPDRYEILLIIALGKPKEEVVIEAVPESGDIKYWRDAEKVHHVPKRSLEEVIII